MQTHPIVDAKIGAHPYAFEIDVVDASPSTIIQILKLVPEVTSIQPRKPFSAQSEIHVEFEYNGRRYVVWEAYGDNSRYWIGPKDIDNDAPDLSHIESAFKAHKVPPFRSLIGSIVSLRFLHGFFK